MRTNACVVAWLALWSCSFDGFQELAGCARSLLTVYTGLALEEYRTCNSWPLGCLFFTSKLADLTAAAGNHPGITTRLRPSSKGRRDTPTSRDSSSSASETAGHARHLDPPACFPAPVWSIYTGNLQDVGILLRILGAAHVQRSVIKDHIAVGYG